MGSSPRSLHGQEAFERQFQRLFAQDLGLQRFADQRRAAPSTVISTLFRFGSLSSRSLAAEHWRRRPLRWRMESGTPSLRFHQPGQGEIEIVAAQQQVLAHGGAREVDQVAFARDADQAEVAGAAADVADQHDLAVEELLARGGQVVGDPGIERRGGLFEQRQLFECRHRARPSR